MNRVKHLGIFMFLATVAMLTSVSASAQTTATPPALENVSTCFDRTGALQVLFLVDESGSLSQSSSGTGTDPHDQRVAAIKAALSGLARTADRPVDGRELRIDVLLSAFSSGYQHVSNGWQALDGSSVQGLIDTADKFADLDKGLDTDYATALGRASKDLADRSVAVSAESGESPCQILLFFTDGRYDVADRTRGARAKLPPTVSYAEDLPLSTVGNGARVVERGKAALCDAGGITDVIRANGAVTITVALDVDLDASARNFLDALTDGVSPESSCGTTGSESAGYFVSASRSDDLLFAFSRLMDPRQEIRFCESPAPVPCTFDVVQGMSGFVLVATSPNDHFELELTSPAGGSVRLRPDDASSLALGSATLTQRRFSPRALEVESAIAPATSDSTGQWAISFIDPSGGPVTGGGSFTIEYLAELNPGLADKPILQKGESATFELGLFDPAGAIVTDNPLVAGATMTATMSDPQTGQSWPLDVQVSGSGRYTASFEPPLDSAAGTLVLTLDAALAPIEGVSLTSQRRSFELELRPPKDFPRIEPQLLELPTIMGDGVASGSFTVVGSEIADGCVWFEPLEAALPDGTTTPVVLTPNPANSDTCLSVPKGTTHTINVSIDPEQAALGRVAGDLRINLKTAEGDDVQTVVLPIQATMDVEPDAVVARAVLVAMLLLGLLLPIVVLHLLNRAAAKFSPTPQLLRFKPFSVRIENGTLRAAADGSELSADYREFEPVKRDGQDRELSELRIDDATFETHASGWIAGRRWSLLAGPFGVVKAGSFGVLAGDEPAMQAFTRVPAHEVSLALPGTWVFWPERPVTDMSLAASEPVDGTLLLLIRTGRDIDDGERLLKQAEVAVPLRLSELTAMSQSAAASDGASAEAVVSSGGDAGWDNYTPSALPSDTSSASGDAGWDRTTDAPDPYRNDPPESSGPGVF